MPFSIGKRYVDEVICDVIPMDACHLLLGRPWQFDREALHDSRKNAYTFKMDKKTITLHPSSYRKYTNPFLNLKTTTETFS